MAKSAKYVTAVLWLMTGIFIFCILQKYYPFHFYYMEQLYLFRFEKSFLADTVGQAGGLAIFTGQFIVQFFILPYTGSIITTLILLSIGLLMQAILKQVAPALRCPLLFLLPVTILFYLQLNLNFYLHGTIAYVTSLLFIRAWFCFKKPAIAFRYTLFSVPVLGFGFGPVVLLFVSSLLLYNLVRDFKKGMVYLIPFTVTVIIQVVLVYTSHIGSFRHAFLPEGYYLAQPFPAIIYMSWIVIPATILLSYFFRSVTCNTTPKLSLGIWLLQLGLIAGWCAYLFPLYGGTSSLHYKEVDYYSRTGQWEKIIHKNKGKTGNYLELCYLNMALANCNRLADTMFAFDQKDIQGLYLSWNRSLQGALMMSDFFFTTGNVAGAQQMAFEGYVLSQGGSPRFLKRLVQTNLIFGYYPVAEKYIRLLEQTLFYRKWAQSQRKFLNRDQAVEKDPLLGRLKKSILKKNYFYNTVPMDTELADLIDANPQNPGAMQYLGASCLLSKNIEAFQQLLDKYWDTDALPSLPVSFQEAVIILNEGNPEAWRRYRIPEQTLSRFRAYKKLILEHKNNPGLAQLLFRSYGNTYWFFYMFK